MIEAWFHKFFGNGLGDYMLFLTCNAVTIVVLGITILICSYVGRRLD